MNGGRDALNSKTPAPDSCEVETAAAAKAFIKGGLRRESGAALPCRVRALAGDWLVVVVPRVGTCFYVRVPYRWGRGVRGLGF